MNRLPQDLFLGIDGGGTSTRAALVDDRGQLLARAESGPGNYIKAGLPVVRRSLEELRRRLFGRGTHMPRLRVICAGLAGSGRPADHRILRRLFAEVLPSERLQIESDGFVALYGATRGGPGILAISGTGSIVVGMGKDGKRIRAGGWGHLWGDEGSGYDIGRRGIRAVVNAHDGRGPETALTSGFLRLLGAKTVPESVVVLYGSHHTPEGVAALAQTVFEKAVRHDAVALAVLQEAAQNLSLTVEAAARRLGFIGSPVRIYLSGGSFKSRIYSRIFQEAVSGRLPQAICGTPALPAEMGAALLAVASAQ